MNVLLAWLRLAGLFFKEFALSVKDVAVTILNPRKPIRSAILAVPLDIQSDAGITLFANMITLTPGTTSVHVSEDRKTLYCHVLNGSDEIVAQIKDGFERHVKEVLP